jgi:hypothetical protein
MLVSDPSNFFVVVCFESVAGIVVVCFESVAGIVADVKGVGTDRFRQPVRDK